MSDLTKADAVAALRRAAKWSRTTPADRDRLRALADVIEQAQEACQGPDYADQISTDAVIGWSPVWIIPAPSCSHE
jgi:hypothetical protein